MTPRDVVESAASAFAEVFESLPDMAVSKRGEPCKLDVSTASCGALIALEQDDGQWLLALLCDRPSCVAMTRAMFAMEPDEEPQPDECADALGELANIAAGVFKTSLSNMTAGELSVRLGLPHYLSDSDLPDFAGQNEDAAAIALDGAPFQAHVVVSWIAATP